ncbi:MAG: homocysteine S-methyltransferase family protein [Clostridia bacterium]|nr:homocysteine S-methyltransferase family protein [Clostridia bacterium]
MNLSKLLLLDGATGTNLISAGMKPGERTADFVLANPAVMSDLIRRYIESGAQVVYTPTFGVNPEKFGNGYSEILKKLIYLTKETVEKYGNGKVLIASDISPCGLFGEPMGKATFNDIYTAFAGPLKVFTEENVDVLSFMTMYSLSESRTALLACKELSDKPVFASVTVDANGKTMTGSDIKTCVSLLGSLGAASAGFNCSTGPLDMLSNVRAAYSVAKAPLYCKPNAGTDVENYLSPSDFAEAMRALINEGACVVGGCCGTTPEHIAALAKILPQCAAKLPVKDESGKITVCTEKTVYEFASSPSLSPAYDVDTFVEEAFDFDPDEYDAAEVEVNSETEAKELLGSLYMFDIPLAVTCDEKTALTLAREYCGNLMFTSRCGFDAEIKNVLSKRYASVFI